VHCAKRLTDHGRHCPAAHYIELFFTLDSFVFTAADSSVLQCSAIKTAVFNLFTRAGQAAKIQPSGQLADIGCKTYLEDTTIWYVPKQRWEAFVLVLISRYEDQAAIFAALKAEMTSSLFTFADQGQIPYTSLFDLSAAQPTSVAENFYANYHYWYCPDGWDPDDDASKESPQPALCEPPGAVMYMVTDYWLQRQCMCPSNVCTLMDPQPVWALHSALFPQ
jgi:hypothetical protein